MQFLYRVKTLKVHWTKAELIRWTSLVLSKHGCMDYIFWGNVLIHAFCGLFLLKHEPCLLTLKERCRLSKPSAWGNFSISPTWGTRPTTGCGERSISTLVHRKRWKLAWLRHVTSHNSLSKTILQGILEGGRCHGWQRKCWMDNSKEWTSLAVPDLLTRASCRKGWKRISVELSLMFPLMAQSVKELNWTSCFYTTPTTWTMQWCCLSHPLPPSLSLLPELTALKILKSGLGGWMCTRCQQLASECQTSSPRKKISF